MSLTVRSGSFHVGVYVGPAHRTVGSDRRRVMVQTPGSLHRVDLPIGGMIAELRTILEQLEVIQHGDREPVNAAALSLAYEQARHIGRLSSDMSARLEPRLDSVNDSPSVEQWGKVRHYWPALRRAAELLIEAIDHAEGAVSP